MNDVRWQQRFQNFQSALAQLSAAVDLAGQRALSDLEKQGLIQGFEYTHELAWNVMKDYFVYQGDVRITGSRDATREAFKQEIISNGEVWMEMIQSRNKSTHTYNRATADEICRLTITAYHPEFLTFRKTFLALAER